ncbi:MAG: ABC transporter ATP-binding protein [Cyclobacteriaceae bacterium]|nr:ABC transporter ATP-binding protein [Cyclobacteriaceae bacterium]
MLKVENLFFHYPGNPDNTLKNLSFSIGKGEIFGFLGPSGSGKSTTQKILYKLLGGYSGKILFEDIPLGQWGTGFYERIGVSFELPNHYIKLTAVENLRFFGSFYRKKAGSIADLLKQVGLAEEGDKPVSEYSKGMKMRLNFIRSLLHDPDVFFFDEPTTGLDPIYAGKIKQMIRELKDRGKTIFLTTHNMFDADQLCDRVALLHLGEIRAIDSPYNLKMKYGKPGVMVTKKNASLETFNFPMTGLGKNREFLKILNENEVVSIHSQEATLEEVFVKLTGDQLV